MDKIFGPKGLLSSSLPGFEERPGQLTMAEKVAFAMENDEILLYEAPTGTGKTLAYLAPALLCRHKVVISTGTKNLQEQILFKDLPLAEQVLGVQIKKAVMKGRQNYLCLNRLRLFSAQPMFKAVEEEPIFEMIRKWSTVTKTGDRDELSDLPDDFSAWNEINSNPYTCRGQRCLHNKECFVTKMRRRAAEADLIIVNHHLFFADLAVKQEGGEVIPNYGALVLDEAHQIEDVATSFFGLQVSTYRVEELARDVSQVLNAHHIVDPKIMDAQKSVRAASDRFFDGFRRSGDEKFRLRQESVTSDILESETILNNALGVLRGRLSKYAEDEARDDLVALENRIDRLLEEIDAVIDLEDLEQVHWGETRKRGVFLNASPIDLSGSISELIFSAAPSIVLCSATLTTEGNFDFLKDRLAIEEEVMEAVGPSCFEYGQQAALYLPREFPMPSAHDFPYRVAEQLEEMLLASQGRAFCLFTSYKNMHAVYDLLAPRLPFTTLLQGQGSKTSILDQFREDAHSVLFATSSFWEGVDVIGNALAVVVIDKLPFASPGEPVVEARIDALRAKGKNPFVDYQLPQAIITLKQGLGRLIRHRDDRGLLALMDVRVRTKNYGRRILDSLPQFPVTGDLEAVCALLRRLNDQWDGNKEGER